MNYEVTKDLEKGMTKPGDFAFGQSGYAAAFRTSKQAYFKQMGYRTILFR